MFENQPEAEREFVEVSLIGEPIADICPCLATGVKHVITESRFAHCEHRLFGFYAAADRPFKKIAGIERTVFRDLVARVCLAAELKLDIAHGAVELAQEASDATKH